MLEWLKRHAWKACILQKGIGGSNPPLSAKDKENRPASKLAPVFFVFRQARRRRAGMSEHEVRRNPGEVGRGLISPSIPHVIHLGPVHFRSALGQRDMRDDSPLPD